MQTLQQIVPEKSKFVRFSKLEHGSQAYRVLMRSALFCMHKKYARLRTILNGIAGYATLASLHISANGGNSVRCHRKQKVKRRADIFHVNCARSLKVCAIVHLEKHNVNIRTAEPMLPGCQVHRTHRNKSKHSVCVTLDCICSHVIHFRSDNRAQERERHREAKKEMKICRFAGWIFGYGMRHKV